MHKGSIAVESEEGKGTIFKIAFPLGKDHLKPEEICESISSAEENIETLEKSIMIEESRTEKSNFNSIYDLENPLLLIVEDNSDIRYYLNNNLKDCYRVLEAADGEDGWSKCIEHLPDIIISDVMMPRMDGFQFCEKIKTDERTSHIPIILLTAKAASRDKIEGFEIGADDYIMKPFDIEELKVRIKNLISQRKRIHEHFKKHGIIEFEESNITSVDKIFLEKVFNSIVANISNASFSVEELADKVRVSRSVFYKKINSLIGESPGELIRRIRLNKSAELIQKKFGNISEIAIEVGFNNPAYFTECFKKQFGVTPTKYNHKLANY